MMRKTERHEWTVNDILVALHQLAVQLGRTPTARDLQRAPLGSVPKQRTLCRRLQSLTNAQRLAGCSPNPRWRSLPDRSASQLIADLRALAADWGRTPSSKDVSLVCRATGRIASHSAYVARFGSWAAALRIAKLPPAPLPPSSQRRSHCRRGHPLSGFNLMDYGPTRYFPKGYRRCRRCFQARQARYDAQRRNGQRQQVAA